MGKATTPGMGCTSRFAPDSPFADRNDSNGGHSAPLAGIETAITHRYPGGKDPNGREDQPLNPQQRVNLEQAIVAYTSAGAYLLHEDAMRGSLSAGLAADLVVLGRNLFDTPPLEIHDVTVDMTVIDGKVVYERNAR